MQDQEKKIMHAMIFCGAMLIVAIFGILLLSRRINYNRQMEQIDHYTMELAERTAQHVGDVFEAKRDAISSMAYLYGKGLDSAQVDQEQLRELEENPGFDRIRYVNDKGDSYTSDRKVANVSERDYFQNGMQGLSGYTVVEESVFDSQRLMGFYAPVYFSGQVCGVMVGFVEPPSVTTLLATEYGGFTANTMVVTTNAKILGQAMETGEPIYDDLEQIEDHSGDPEGLKQALETHSKARIDLYGENGPTVGYVIPVPNTPWMLIQCFPPQAAAQSVDAVNRDEQRVMLLFLLAVLLFSAGILYQIKKRSALEQERANAARVTTLLGNVSDDYVCLIDVNLKTEQEEQFRMSGGALLRDWARGDYDYTHCVTGYANEVVCEKDRAEFLRVTSLPALKEVLAGQKNFYHEYDAVIDGKPVRLQEKYTLCTDQFPEPHILIGIRDITELIREKLKTKTSMDLIVSAASTVYPYILEENLTRNKAHTVYNQGIVHRGRMEHFTVDEMLEGLRETVLDPEDYARVTKLLRCDSLLKAYAEGTRDLKLRIRQKADDGLMHWMGVRTILMKNGGGDICAITMVRCIDDDIQRTEDLERAKEAAESASRAKSTFLFNMSHDIRTPLNAIMGFSAMAERYVNDEEKVMDCLKKINVSGEHLLNLINNVLDMARIESGRVELNPKPHRIRDSILNLSCIFQADARKKNLDLRFLVEVEDEIAVFDLLRTNQIILNLVGNAIKYTPEGGSIRVSFRQEGREGDRARYCFSVKDTGIGMSEAFQRNVFVAFERENRAATSGVEGTGLGLSITQRLVELMDGTISCTSEQGKGSEFVCRFRFPVAGPESLEEQGGAGDRELKAEGKRILLVEDNALNREISREILEADGFTVEDADDGDVAVEKIRWAEPGYFDLVLMDIQMPRMDGYEATRRIRALDNPELARIPIVAVTANAFEEDRTAALEAGMDGHVAKPIDVRILRQTIARYL